MITVVPHCAYLSEKSRMLEIHRALRDRGAPVRLATHGGTHQNLLGREGVDYDLIEPRLTPARCAELVAALHGVDAVVVFEEDSADALIERLRPDVHAKGTDYTEQSVPERATVASVGARVAIAGDPKSHSTKDLITTILTRFGRT